MISIIIPTLNEESVLAETLEYLKKLTLPHEIIISDGNSSDKTVEIAKKYTDKILVHKEDKRQTIAHAKNSGAAQAAGDYYVFIDADILIKDIDNFFQALINDFEKDETLAGATVSLRVMEHLATRRDEFFFDLVNRTHALNNNILKIGSASGEFQMIRASYFKQAGGYNELLAVAEDNDMFARLAKLGKTRMYYDMQVFHTGRRAHNIGWTKLLYQWFINYFSVVLFKKSAHKEWKPIR